VVPCLVVADDIVEAEAFGGAIFEVAHVEVSAAAVEKKAAIASGLVPIALVHIDQAEALVAEYPIANACEDDGGSRQIICQASVFGLEACDAVHLNYFNPGVLRWRSGSV
jgi:hypothetical protein